MNYDEKLSYLIKYLIDENTQYSNISIPTNKDDKFNLFRSLVNVRSPKPIKKDFLTIQDELLKDITSNKKITDYHTLTPIRDNIYLWQGDITTLKCDAIVNACNSGLTGCYYPCHKCIDNSIHTFSGVQLRLSCNEIINKQGHEEFTGLAKITKSYNLPCNYIIHTVGTIVKGKVTKHNIQELENCYTSCLKIATENNIKSIAFCCISTGEYCFPNELASEIAINTVTKYLKKNPMEVIFNVFKPQDYEIYKRLLTEN